MAKPRSKLIITLFLLSGAILFLVADWFAMSSLDYSPATRYFPFRTSGWFILGLVFALPFSMAYAALFLLVSRWLRFGAAWSVMVAAAAALIWGAILAALPRSQLTSVVGEKAANAADIELFRSWDSFNDGTFCAGVILGKSDLMSMIREQRKLGMKGTQCHLPLFKEVFPDVELPESGDLYSDEHGSFFSSSGGTRVFFVYRSRVSARENTTGLSGKQDPVAQEE